MKFNKRYRVRVSQQNVYYVNGKTHREPDFITHNDLNDKVFNTEEGALEALKEEIKELNEATLNNVDGKNTRRYKIKAEKYLVVVFEKALDWKQMHCEESKLGLSYSNHDGELVVFEGHETKYTVESFYPVIREQ